MAFASLVREPGFYEAVGAHGVNGLLVGAMDVNASRCRRSGFDAKGRAASSSSCHPSLGNRRFGRVFLSLLICLGGISKRRQGPWRSTRPETRVLERDALRSDSSIALAVAGCQMAVQAGRDGWRVTRAPPGLGRPCSTRSSSLSKGTVGCLSMRVGVGQLGLGHAYGIDDYESVLVAGVRGHGIEVGGGDCAHAAPLHLLEEAAAADIPHEEDHLHRLDVRAGGNHVNGHDDAGVVAVAEGGQQVFRLSPRWSCR